MIAAVHRTLINVITLVSQASIVVAAIGLGDLEWWLCDLFANLRIHVVVALILLLPIQFFLDRRLLAFVTSAMIFVNVYALIDKSSSANHMDNSQPPGLTVVSYNLGRGTRKHSATYEFLGDTHADIIIVQEYSLDWHEKLQQLSENYPYRVAEPREDSYGIALFSRYPLIGSVTQNFPGSQIPIIIATALVGDQEIDVIGLHLRWPAYPSLFAERNGQIIEILSVAKNRNNEVVVCGDWNVTPWSGWYRKIIDAGLHDGGGTNRYSPTWPAPLGWVGIPIDHCFVSTDLAIVNKVIGPSPGSDHRPLSITISLGQHRRPGM